MPVEPAKGMTDTQLFRAVESAEMARAALDVIAVRRSEDCPHPPPPIPAPYGYTCRRCACFIESELSPPDSGGTGG